MSLGSVFVTEQASVSGGQFSVVLPMPTNVRLVSAQVHVWLTARTDDSLL